jgi:hypothetical protein
VSEEAGEQAVRDACFGETGWIARSEFGAVEDRVCWLRPLEVATETAYQHKFRLAQSSTHISMSRGGASGANAAQAPVQTVELSGAAVPYMRVGTCTKWTGKSASDDTCRNATSPGQPDACDSSFENDWEEKAWLLT